MMEMDSEQEKAKIQEIWQKAEKHRQASMVGIPSDNANYELCSCCGEVVQKQSIPLCEHTKQFQRYGFGYPLWFTFLKCCIILVLVLIASKTTNELYMAANENWDFCYGNLEQGTSNSQNTASNVVQQQKNIPQKLSSPEESYNQNSVNANPRIDQINSPEAKNQQHNLSSGSSSGSKTIKCTSFMVFLSIFKGEKMSQNYFLKTVQFLIHLSVLVFVRNIILKEEQYYDERTTLISKYSIIIHNLPNVVNLKRKVKQMLEKQFDCSYGEEDSEVKELIYVFKDEELTKLNEQKQKLQEEIIKTQTSDDEKLEKYLIEKLVQVQHELQQKKSQTRQKINNDQVTCNKMIVVMNTEGDKASVLYSFKEATKEGRNFTQYFFELDQMMTTDSSLKPINILMKEAPEPNEIIWEHLDESDQDRKFLIFRGYIFTFLFLAVITVVFYFIMLAKTSLFIKALEMEQNDPNNLSVQNFKAFATVIVFLALFGVVLFNKFIMGNILHLFVHTQHHAYTDKQNHSFAIKYALGMFFTTALMTIAVQALTYNNFYAHQYGVIEEETIMFFVTAFIIPLIWWIHPYKLMKDLRRKKVYGTLMTQKQANQIVENFPYMLGKRYAEIFEIMWFTFLYSELIPLGSFLMLFGLLLYYWVDKYNFLRKSAVKTRVSGKMAILGLKSLDATLFLSPAGQLLFSFVLRNHFDYPSLIFTFVGIIYTCLPVTSFIWQLNGQKFLIQQKTYDESKKRFKQTYYSLHPIYKLTHKDEIQKQREIVNEFYREDLKKVKHYGTGRGNYKRQMTLITKRSDQNQPMKI